MQDNDRKSSSHLQTVIPKSFLCFFSCQKKLPYLGPGNLHKILVGPGLLTQDHGRPNELQVQHLPLLAPHTRPRRLRDIQKLKFLNTKSVLKCMLGTILGLFCTWYQNNPGSTRNDFSYDTRPDLISGPTKENRADSIIPQWVQRT